MLRLIILRMPILDLSKQDSIIWEASKDGIYSMRSAYKLIMLNLTDVSEFHVLDDWQKLWALKVPTRVKNMLQRSCRHCIPTRINLKSCGVDCPIICPLILHLVEDIASNVETFAEFIFALFNDLHDHHQQQMAMLLWRRRNDKVWDNKAYPDSHVIAQGDEFFQSWSRFLSVTEDEAWSLLSALQFLQSFGLEKVILKIDNKSVAERVTLSCREILEDNLTYRVPFIRRQANREAYELARAALLFPSLHNVDHVLSCIQHLILNKMI
ncbi:hypothetical protein GmHk_14G040731 [Glycine max]|nr:hypothetical protein GmHk_14G040731 [Glycine max]